MNDNEAELNDDKVSKKLGLDTGTQKPRKSFKSVYFECAWITKKAFNRIVKERDITIEYPA